MKKFIFDKFKDFSSSLKSIPSYLVTIFVLSVVLMNILANKSLSLPFEFLALDGGFFVSWICFLCMDIVVKNYGVKASINLNFFSIIVTIFVSLIFLFIASIEGQWSEAFGSVYPDIVNNAINNTFKSNVFIIFGSLVAFACSGVVNALINFTIGKNLKDNFKNFAFRSSVSTFIAQFVDNLVFSLIVSHSLFGWSFIQCISCSLIGAIAELLCEVIFLPLGYLFSKNKNNDNNNI